MNKQKKRMKTDNIFSRVEDVCNVSGNATFLWSKKGTGFGELYFYEKDGVTHCHNEFMNKKTVKDILNIMVDQCEFDDK